MIVKGQPRMPIAHVSKQKSIGEIYWLKVLLVRRHVFNCSNRKPSSSFKLIRTHTLGRRTMAAKYFDLNLQL